jgi:nucleotide-binding universal stress UspA family protein
MSPPIGNPSPTRVELEIRPAATHRNPARRGPVLLATDGLGKNGAPVLAARRIAEHLRVPLEVVTVIELQGTYGAALNGIPVYFPQLDDELEASRLADVREYVARHSTIDAAPPPVHVAFGSVAANVARVAAERAATLIVVGAAPHQRLKHIVAGERAAHVLRSSTVPVLSVPPGFDALPRRVIVAVDFSPASTRAAKTALLLATSGATITLLHVLSPLLGDLPLRGIGSRDLDTPQRLFGRLLDDLRPFVPQGVTIETHVRTDEDVEGIVDTAASRGAELVVVGTHGPRLLGRLLLGSVASGVLHNAAQAVLAVPPPPPGESLELSRRITGTATSERPAEWGGGLDAFTKRNAGRRVAIEVDDPDVGARMLGYGALVGVTYDPHDRRVEIALGDPLEARRHLLHSIEHVDYVALTADERAGSETLEIWHDGGQTLVLVA